MINGNSLSCGCDCRRENVCMCMLFLYFVSTCKKLWMRLVLTFWTKNFKCKSFSFLYSNIFRIQRTNHMHYFFKILVLIVGYRNEVIFANVVGTSPGQQTEAPVTVTCPRSRTLKSFTLPLVYVLFQWNVHWSWKVDKNRCQKYASVTCVGTKTSTTGKCYDWNCSIISQRMAITCWKSMGPNIKYKIWVKNISEEA